MAARALPSLAPSAAGARPARTFYLDPLTGDTVANNGLTPATAWGPLWSVLKLKTLTEGDDLALARGYHGKLMFMASPKSNGLSDSADGRDIHDGVETQKAGHVTIRPIDATHVPVFASMHFALGVSNWHVHGHAIVCDGFRPATRNGKEPWGVVTRCGIPWSFGVTVANGCKNILLQGLSVMSAPAPARTGVSIDGQRCTLQDVHVTGGHGIVMEPCAEGVAVINCVVERPTVGHGVEVRGKQCVLAGVEVVILPPDDEGRPASMAAWTALQTLYPQPTWLPSADLSEHIAVAGTASASVGGGSSVYNKRNTTATYASSAQSACLIASSEALDGKIVSSRFLGGAGITAPVSVTVSKWVVCNNVIVGALGVDFPRAVNVEVVHNTVMTPRKNGVIVPVIRTATVQRSAFKGAASNLADKETGASNVAHYNRVITQSAGVFIDVSELCVPPTRRFPCERPCKLTLSVPYIGIDARGKPRPFALADVDAGAFQASSPLAATTGASGTVPGSSGTRTVRVPVTVTQHVDVLDSVGSAPGVYVAWEMPPASNVCKASSVTRWFAEQLRWPVTTLQARIAGVDTILATCRTGATSWFVPCDGDVATGIRDTVRADVSWPAFL